MAGQGPDPFFTDAQLESWLEAQGALPRTLEPLAGDVSLRRYGRLDRSVSSSLPGLKTRLETGIAHGTALGSAIVALYPEEVRDVCARFEATTALLTAAGVRVPTVLAADCVRGFMLLEDLGPRTLYELEAEPWSALLPYFEEAVAVAGRISGLPAGQVTDLSPPLDGALLTRELRQTWEVFLDPEGLLGPPAFGARLRDVLGELVAALAAAKALPCHRDFMARNLVPLVSPADAGSVRKGRRGATGHLLAVLDHQDLRLGPPCYDLASLLNDSLFPPPEIEAHLLGLALPPGSDPTPYHRAAAQRTLKAVGTFAAFARRGADRHLPLIPPTLGRAVKHLELLPESRDLVPELRRRWAGRFC